MEKERDGHQPSDSFVSLSKSPSSQASEGRHGRFDAEASCQGNGNISRCKSSGCQRNPNEKRGQQGAPGAAWGGGTQDSERQQPCLTLCWLPFFSALLHPWEAGSSPRALLEVEAFNSWFEGFGQFKPPRAESLFESLRFECDFLFKQKSSWA